MLYELQYTSAPRGLAIGTSGFCTVKASAGLPAAVRLVLESLSSYRALYPPGDAQAANNPIGISYLGIQAGSLRWNALSRISAAPLDYSGRSNFFAHHFTMPADEWSAFDPAWLASHPDLLDRAWDGRVEEVQQARSLPRGREVSRICDRWASAAGDSGWAGVLAQQLQQRKGAYLVFEPGAALIPLVAEVFSLLPMEVRARTTFSTYYCGLPAQVDCLLRCVVAGSAEHEAARRSSSLVVDLGARQPLRAESMWVTKARTGKVEEPVLVAAASAATYAPLPRDDGDYSLTPLPGIVSAPMRKELGASPPPTPARQVALPTLGIEAAPADRGWSWGGIVLGLVLGSFLGAGFVAPFLYLEKRAQQTRVAEHAALVAERDHFKDASETKDETIKGLQQQGKLKEDATGRRETDLGALQGKFNTATQKLDDSEKEVIRLKDENKRISNANGSLVANVENLKAQITTLNETKEEEIKNRVNKEVTNELAKKKNEDDARRDEIVRIPLLPHPSVENAIEIKELTFRPTSFELKDSPASVTLSKVDMKNHWKIVHETTHVATLIAIDKGLRFQWVGSESTSEAKLKQALADLVYVSVIAKNAKEETPIPFWEEVKRETRRPKPDQKGVEL